MQNKLLTLIAFLKCEGKIIMEAIRHPTRFLAEHTFGKKHSTKHKCISGTAIGFSGVALTFVAPVELHFFADAIGYLLHGIGAYPFIEAMVLAVQNEE